MPKNQRFRRLTDLFVTGKAVPMPDGTHLWIQIINAFERDEAISDAQIARARIVLALKEDGRERIKVQGRLAELGQDVLADELARTKSERKVADFADEMRVDPDWKERMDIVLRTDWDNAAKPPSEEETLLMARINAEILQEFARREEEERTFLERKFLRMSEEEIMDEWVDEWLEKRGSELATAEYRLTELWYATRYCVATADPNGDLDHSHCDGHRERVFEDKADARTAPDELQELLRYALDDVNLAGRDPKDSDSPPSSSDSPPTPSEEAESIPSTSSEIPAPPPGF